MPVGVSYSTGVREEGTNVVVYILDMRAFSDSDDEEAQEDIPQIERELFPQMRTDKGGLGAAAFLLLVTVCVDAQGALLVDVGLADADGDGEDGDVHHDCAVLAQERGIKQREYILM